MHIIGLLGSAGSGKSTIATFLTEHATRTARIAFADEFKYYLQEVFQFPTVNLYGSTENRNRHLPEIADPARWQAEFSLRLTTTVGEFTGKTLALYREHPRALLLQEKIKTWFLDMREKVLDGREPASARRFCQTFGTEMGRKFDTDIWVNVVERRLERERLAQTDLVLVDDCRMINEAQMLRRLDGDVWRLLRTADDSNATAKERAHASEQAQFAPEMDTHVSYILDNRGSLEETKKLVLRRFQELTSRANFMRA